MKKCDFIFVFLFTVLLSSCSKNDNETSIETNSSKPNILLIIADDMGKDATTGFSEGIIKPNTPNINSIKNDGISFNNFWVYPTCSPTRASIITGKYGFRTNVNWANDILSDSETILQNYINQQTNNAYDTSLIGKWHLSGNGTNISNPELMGMDYYAGLFGGGVQSYDQWMLAEDGLLTSQTAYITEKFTDLAIDRINSQEKPWFLWLAYTAPHTPFHAPPSNMHTQGNLPDYSTGMDAMPYYMAAIEAMDFQIGRLLDSIPENERNNTIIIFIGDNGTPNQVAQSPYSSSTVKGSIYQGGINTPLFVSGQGVTRIGHEDDNLITSTDLFATIAQIAGSSTSEINDSKSFQPLFTEPLNIRNFQYSELNDGTNNIWTISNGEYKLFVNTSGNQEMYNLSTDPYEGNNLLLGTLNSIQQTAKTELESELLEIRQ
ncbi:MAG: arylsulfatase B [Saprospiraceae bacterium]|jgi:arylsulfatase A-like enzyme